MADLSIDIDSKFPQKAIISLPQNFQIKTLSDINILQEFVAHTYFNSLRLYRGHESLRYKLESTIVRLMKKKKKNSNCTIQDIVSAEEKGLDLFRKNVFNADWLRHKTEKTSTKMFLMSVGRHLGLPCRLIDFTASLETAIWFAVMNKSFHNEDGEIVLIVIEKDNNINENNTTLNKKGIVSHSHEHFLGNSLSEQPLGEKRRFIQNGHFLWVEDDSLTNEQQALSDSVFCVKRFTIPRQSKPSLALALQKDVYYKNDYHSQIDQITNFISKS